jgi:hypothetical protein
MRQFAFDFDFLLSVNLKMLQAVQNDPNYNMLCQVHVHVSVKSGTTIRVASRYEVTEHNIIIVL